MATILIADGRLVNRDFLVTLLGYDGHRMLEAADGAEALEKTRAEHPDLAIVDILMSVRDGFEYARQVRADPAIAHTRIVLYTDTYLDTEARRLAEACGVTHFIAKPSEPEDILRIVNEALGLVQPAPVHPLEHEFDRERLRLMTNKLLETVSDLEAINAELEQRVQARTAELTQANERLQELDRLKSKFIADMSHELRMSVGNLKLHLELLEKGKPEKRPLYLSVLKEQAARLTHLIEEVFDLSRLDLGAAHIAFGAVDLNDLAAMVIAMHRPRAEAAGLSLLFAPYENVLPVCGEINQLAHAIANLIENAINYTRRGGVRVITCLASERQLVCLQVEDTGIGIPPEDVPHLFKRFYRGRNIGQFDIPGAGLGLSIVKEIVDLHTGRVEVDSRPGEGSAFRVWLPLREA